MEVIKRDGRREAFDIQKIEQAIGKAIIATYGHADAALAHQLAFGARMHLEGKEVTVESIQNAVQVELIVQGKFNVEHAYREYRERHSELRAAATAEGREIPADRRWVRSGQTYFDTEIQKLQFYDKYSRFQHDLNRRETWPEAVIRVIDYLINTADPQHKISPNEWQDLCEAILGLEIMPSMRLLQMAGPALTAHGQVGAYNCAYLPIDTQNAFVELLFILMQGTGVGYSVESRYISKLPKVGHMNWHMELSPTTVEDSTEGWCNALVYGLTQWWSGVNVKFDYSLIRPQGAPLKTKGGRASGPEPLKRLLDFVYHTLLGAQGRQLTTLECHEIACMCGDIVHVGGVRRAALICLFDRLDLSIANCKSGEWWNEKPWLAMANNSAVFEHQPSIQEFLYFWGDLVDSGSGEPGIFNRQNAYETCANRMHKRDAKHDFGTNPCGEIILRPRQFCNLTIAVARPEDTLFDLKRKVRLATLLGTLQSTLTNFGYLEDLNGDWKKNCEEERLLGVDITGIQDNPVLQYRSQRICFPPMDADGKPMNWLARRESLALLRDYAISMNQLYAEALGIPHSASVTCVKPSGNSSQLLNTASGLHARFAPYYIRRFRIGAYTPIAALLKESGVPYNPENGQNLEDATVLVFEFPVASPADALTQDKMSAYDQLQNWLELKLYYTEHNPSTTVRIAPEEWISAADWIFSNWNFVGGLAFLPKDGGSYTLAPYEEITKERYEELLKAMPTVDYSKLVRYEREDQTTGSQEWACTGDKCEL
jgi:ribonucleoside-diphosphate reductase alpha chain